MKGRPIGYRKPEGTRKQHQLRAYPDEWILISAFEKIVKYGDKSAAKNFVDNHSVNKSSR